MNPIRVVTVFGTRPEAIKLAPVIQALEDDARFISIPVVTAQHREMLDQVLSLFSICPLVDLDLMTEDQSLANLTAAVFTHLDPLLDKYTPDWLLVQGDTTTAMAAALLAYDHRIRVGHVEAGLRTGDKWQPFPEEMNRRVVSVVADLHFAPTDWARTNLLREGIPDNLIQVTGNTIIDALNRITALPIPQETADLLTALNILNGEKQLILVTAHRRENFGEPIRAICEALRQIASSFHQRMEIVYPVHLNPNIDKPVHELLQDVPGITLLPPLDYLPLVHLLKQARIILSDSGGIQEEATGLGVPCLVLRQVTERPEGVEAGVLKLVGTSTSSIVHETSRLLEDEVAWSQMARSANPYGEGHASDRILEALISR